VPVYTDAPDLARALLALPEHAAFAPAQRLPAAVAAVLGSGGSDIGERVEGILRHGGGPASWQCVTVTKKAATSQIETLAGLARRGTPIPDGMACIAADGSELRGFRGRSWAAATGNIHLTVHLAPECAIPRFETAFLALAAVAAVDAIDVVPGLRGRAGIRWVNDLVIDGAKVGGVLARTQSRGEAVTGVLLGVGLNVETPPAVAPTPFVPRTGALCRFAPDPASAQIRAVLSDLLEALRVRYAALVRDGYAPVLAEYRARSTVLGQVVRVSDDLPGERPEVFAEGRVRGIGDGLELLLDGHAQPVRRGRLVIELPQDLGSEAAANPATGRRVRSTSSSGGASGVLR
jgi:biotin-(acetyl-CoA carboxylase) ligase